MAEKAEFEVEFEYTSAGAAKVQADLDRLIDKVDDLRREGEVTEKGQDELSGAIIRTGSSLGQLSKDTDKARENIVALRYASYDMGRTLLTAAGTLTAVGVGVSAAFASQEKEFANVIRTAEGGVGDLENALKDLSTAIPVSFNDLAKIATLGNQLGVAGADIEAFTETIATFSAATGIGFEASAEAFGKLGNLLGVGADEYDRLGSAITYVGRTTAASEAQIISIAREIAPAAAAAGFAADEVIGLSGALGSLGVPPERSRSTILQFFETLNTAVANGGQDLEYFAQVVGVTAAELESMVRSGQGESILSQFVNRAATVDTVELTQALQELGLAGLRTNPTIRALAQNTDLVATSIEGGRQAWQENIELQRQMEIINSTVSASWDRFVNALMNGAATIGATAAPALKNLLDLAIDLINGFSDFVQSPFGNFLTRLVGTLAVAATTFLAVRGAIALATGSALALKFALQQGITLGIISGLKGLANALGLVRSGAVGAAGGVGVLTNALRVLGRATVIFAVFQLAADLLFDFEGAMLRAAQTAVNASNVFANLFGGLADLTREFAPALSAAFVVIGAQGKQLSGNFLGWAESIQKVDSSASSTASTVSQIQALTAGADDTMGDLAGSTDDVADAAGRATNEVRTLLDYSSDLAGIWSRAFDIRFSGQETLDTITSQFIKIREENDRAATAIRNLRNDIRGLNSDISIQEYYLSIAIEYGDTLRAAAIEAELEKTRATLADKTAELQVEQDKATKSLVGNTSANIEQRQTIRELVSGYQSHIEALAASGASQETLLAETARLKAEFIQQATQLGYNQEELALYASAFDDVTTAINLVPRNITVTANANPAIQAFNEMQAAANNANNAVNSLRGNLGTPIGTAGINTGPLQNAGLIAEAAALRKMLFNEAFKNSAAGAGAVYGAIPQGRLNQLSSWGYANGGYTGQGGKYEPAGVVHRGEYVIPKRDVNQNTGLPYADALGRHTNGVRGYATGGYVRPSNSSNQMGAVALTAGTIQALAQAVQQYIVVDGRVLGETTSNAFAQSTSVGAN